MKKVLIPVAIAIVFASFGLAWAESPNQSSPYLVGEWFLGGAFPNS